MRKINLPKILLIIFCIILFISMFGPIFGESIFLVLYFSSFIISPISILLLIIWKLFNRNIKNKYFIPIIFINIILFLISIYLTLHAFDNFMTLS